MSLLSLSLRRDLCENSTVSMQGVQTTCVLWVQIKKSKMMKKKILVPILGALVLGLSAYAGYRTYGAYSEKELESDLLLANVEALATDDEVQMQDCTRAKFSGNCVDKKGMWAGRYVLEVEHYQVPVGSVERCEKESVHGCPPGTTAQ